MVRSLARASASLAGALVANSLSRTATSITWSSGCRHWACNWSRTNRSASESWTCASDAHPLAVKRSLRSALESAAIRRILFFRAVADCFRYWRWRPKARCCRCPRGGPVGLGDLVLGQLLGQHEGVVVVGLPLAAGDLVDPPGVGQDDAVGQRLDQLDEPFIAGGGLDDGLE